MNSNYLIGYLNRILLQGPRDLNRSMTKYILFIIIQSHASFKFHSSGPYFFYVPHFISILSFFPEDPPTIEPDGTLFFGFIRPLLTLNKEYFKWLNNVCHRLTVLQIFSPIQSVNVAYPWIWPELFNRSHMTCVDELCASCRSGNKTIWINRNLSPH